MNTKSSANPFCGELDILEKFATFHSDVDIRSTLMLNRHEMITIGRALNSTLTISHLAISGTHCIIWVVQFDEDSVPLVYVKDVSLNGTYLNERRLKRNDVALLNHGDILSIPFGLEMEFSAVHGHREIDIGKQVIDDNSIRREFNQWVIKDRVLGNGTFGYVHGYQSCYSATSANIQGICV